MPDPNPQDQNQNQNQAPAVTPEEVTAIKAQLDAMRAEVSQAKAALLDPTYIEYVASKAEGRREAKEQAKEAEAKRPKLSDLSPEEYAEVVKAEAHRAAMVEVDAVKMDLATKEALGQVAECAKKYSDFWEYQKEMLQLSKQNPLMTAEQAYHAAKGTSPARPVKPAKAEVPTGMAATKIVREPQKGFSEKANAAWERVFGKETVAG